MRIVQIIPSIEFGGAEIMCENLASEQAKMGHEVCVVSLYDTQNEITNRLSRIVPIYYMNKARGLDFKLIGKLRKVFREFKPDAIHSHLYATKYAFLASLGMKVKRVHTLHSVAKQESSTANRILNRLLYKAKLVLPVALSEEVQKTVVDLYRIDKTQVPVVFNGVPLEKCILKSDYEIGSAINVINVARFNEVKNHIEMVDGFVKAQKIFPQLRLTFVGNGALFEKVKAYAAEKGVSSNIDFYGSTDNVYPLLHSADIFLLASLYEGMPMSIIEAMGTGLPIIASNVGGIPDMIENGMSGLLCEPNSESISRVLCQMIQDVVLREKCGKNAVVTAHTKFSARSMAEEYIVLYTREKGRS